MNIKIRSKDFELTPAIEEYVDKKISSLEKFLGGEREILCEVELGKSTEHHKSGDIFRAEVNITSTNVGQIYAVSLEDDIYKAIDIVRDEAEREIVSKKNKKSTLFKRGALRLKNLLKNIRNK